MKWREFVKDYLTFTRKERIGVLVIAILILPVLFLPEIVSKFRNSRNIPPDTAWFNAIRKIELKSPDSTETSYRSEDDPSAYQYDKRKESYSASKAIKGELFYFDPNKISETEWQKLGLREKTIATIQNYLSKGGHFNKPDDLQRIYGIHKDEFERLAPYIKIELTTSKKGEVGPAKNKTEAIDLKKITPRYSVIDINAADTSSFISLPGIGNKLASRIVNFREKLGGFYAIEQVGETYGLPDSTFQKIKQYLKLENASFKKININTATLDELKAHPYIKYSLANPIVAYRNEHGPFAKVEDIKNVMAVTEDLYKKIAHYLITQ